VIVTVGLGGRWSALSHGSHPRAAARSSDSLDLGEMREYFRLFEREDLFEELVDEARG